ncbi:MAG: pantetheine-phosphate adenylyltransferase [Candidatus Beckwithbacteria bacterium]
MLPKTNVAVAGTFDHLHLGHEQLLKTAISHAQNLYLGLTTDAFIQSTKPFTASLQPYPARLKNLKTFFKPFKVKVEFVPLSDPFGPAIKPCPFDTLVCTPETLANVKQINQIRQKNHLPKLTIINQPLILAADNQPISSTRIRQGIINRQGLFYPDLFRHQLTLPPSQRSYFQSPFGTILTTVKLNPSDFTVAVGDIAALTFTKQNFQPNLAIIDLHTQRRQVFKSLAELKLASGLTTVNPAGIINPDLAKKILICLNKNIPSLLVHGEEDLAVLPSVLLSPLNTVVYYGQPNQCLVKIIVTETAKTKALKLLQKFI